MNHPIEASESGKTEQLEQPAEPVESASTTLKTALSNCVQTVGLDHIQRHLFLCADQTLPKCCTKEAGLQTWDYLKKRLKELGLDYPTPDRPHCIYRTKTNCLRVCQEGPIMVIYPDGVWYCRVTPDVMERIIQEHLINNQIVEEYAFLNQPLSATSKLLME
jgi:(2Fe-2S) ferredoxin